MSDLDWLIQRPVAHRGLHDTNSGIVENTPGAVKAALSYGFAIEVDLQLSKDGEAMVFHDFTLDRLTTSKGRVVARTARQLKRVNFQDTKDRMWTLSELLQLTQGLVPLFIEIKSQWKNVGPLEQRVAEVLRNYDGPACVMSFNPASVIAMKELAPTLTRGLVVGLFADTDEWSHLSAKQRFLRRHLFYGFKARPDFITANVKALPAFCPWLACNLFGLPLLCWTVRTQQDRRTAKRWADQITFEGFVPENPVLEHR